LNRNEIKALTEIAEDLVSYGKKAGADEIEVTISGGNEFNLDVRLEKIENLTEAGSRYLSAKIIKDHRTAYTSSSDLSRETLHRLIKNAAARAELANQDEYAGLPVLSELSTGKNIDLELHDPNVINMNTAEKINLALQTERLGRKDPRISNSHGAGFESREINTILVNSHGFSHAYSETYCSLGLGLQAGESNNLVEGSWYSVKRFFSDLETPEKIAKKAIDRTVRQLNAHKIKTQSVPVIFEPEMTSWLLGFLFTCISGTSIYNRASFLVDKLGQKIARDSINVLDDGLIPKGLGTAPFDSEGIPTRKTTILKNGILKNYLCNTYAAKKLNLSSTGNSSGSAVGPNNFLLLPGNIEPEKIIQSTNEGFLLSRVLGHGLNPLTGDISRGAFGFWIENGEIAYPVSEVTISGNLGRILNSIEQIGSDLELRTQFAGPTIKISELQIAGE